MGKAIDVHNVIADLPTKSKTSLAPVSVSCDWLFHYIVVGPSDYFGITVSKSQGTCHVRLAGNGFNISGHSFFGQEC